MLDGIGEPTVTRPRLILTIDTEEEGLWSGSYEMAGNTVENIRGVPRLQALCDRLGVRPTYLVDAPVVQDGRASEILAEIHDDGRCEIGTHIHPWCNPPFDASHDRQESYLCNLTASRQRAKIEWLTEAISERFGRRPVSFRAGRYGLDIVGARILMELGYRVDSSVIPFMDYSADGGPDFTHAPWQPYFVGGQDLREPFKSGRLLEVPVSVGFNRRDFQRAMACQHFLRRTAVRWTKLEGVLDELRLLRRIKLNPERTNCRDMRILVNHYCESKDCIMVMTFHSTSLSPGDSPYVSDERDLKQLLRRIAKTCEYCLDRQSATTATLAELAL